MLPVQYVTSIAPTQHPTRAKVTRYTIRLQQDTDAYDSSDWRFDFRPSHEKNIPANILHQAVLQKPRFKTSAMKKSSQQYSVCLVQLNLVIYNVFDHVAMVRYSRHVRALQGFQSLADSPVFQHPTSPALTLQHLQEALAPLAQQLGRLTSEVANIKTELQVVKTEVQVVKTELQIVKTEVQVVKTELKVVKTEVQVIKTELQGVKTELHGARALQAQFNTAYWGTLARETYT